MEGVCLKRTPVEMFGGKSVLQLVLVRRAGFKSSAMTAHV